MARPRLDNEGQKELDRVENQIESSVSTQSYDERKNLNVREVEPQTKIAQSDLEKTSSTYLKPKRTFPSREKFNEKFRDDYNREREYVEFIAENHEIIGESLDFCIKKFPGMPVEEWVVPVNKPVCAPKYVRDRIDECGYTVFSTTDRTTNSESGITYYGSMVAEERKQRLSARDVPKTKRIFMGSRSFT